MHGLFRKGTEFLPPVLTVLSQKIDQDSPSLIVPGNPTVSLFVVTR
jgi:hypothetical protein